MAREYRVLARARAGVRSGASGARVLRRRVGDRCAVPRRRTSHAVSSCATRSPPGSPTAPMPLAGSRWHSSMPSPNSTRSTPSDVGLGATRSTGRLRRATARRLARPLAPDRTCAALAAHARSTQVHEQLVPTQPSNRPSLDRPQRLQARQRHVHAGRTRPGVVDLRLGHGHARRPARRPRHAPRLLERANRPGRPSTDDRPRHDRLSTHDDTRRALRRRPATTSITSSGTRRSRSGSTPSSSNNSTTDSSPATAPTNASASSATTSNQSSNSLTRCLPNPEHEPPMLRAHVRPDHRPNVLFIITDQHRADHVGFMGNNVVRTPHLDALAEPRHGVRERLGEQPGVHAEPQHAHDRPHAVEPRRDHQRPLVGVGRKHLRPSLPSRGLPHRPARQVAPAERRQPAHLAGQPARAGDVRRRGPTAGTNSNSPSTTSTGIPRLARRLLRLRHRRTLAQPRRSRRGTPLPVGDRARCPPRRSRRPADGGQPAGRGGDPWWQVYDPPYGEEFHSSSFVADRTINFIEEAAAEDSPWLAWASFPDPHHPFTPPGSVVRPP